MPIEPAPTTARQRLRWALIRAARVTLNRIGLDLVHFTPSTNFAGRRIDTIRGRGVTVVVDIGANVGFYGRQLRSYGFTGTIVSCEPSESAFRSLAAEAAGDERWICRRLALARERGERELHLAGRQLESSSLLRMNDRHIRANPATRPFATETVQTARLDDLRPALVRPHDRALVKVDVQGAELEVLDSGPDLLGQTEAVEVELSFLALYDAQPLAGEVISVLDRRGFGLVALREAFRDATSGELLQVDGLFVRRSL